LYRKGDVPSVTEADGNIRTFLERRLDYRVKATLYINVSRGSSAASRAALPHAVFIYTS
jgi:hypothetical protein